VLAIALHELAHIALARACGLQVKRMGISWIGPYLVREQGAAAINICVTLAGPLTNVLLAAAFWRAAPLFAQVNLILGMYNLLPFVPQTDGKRAWDALRTASRITAVTMPRLSDYMCAFCRWVPYCRGCREPWSASLRLAHQNAQETAEAH
jgi:Zn-dependent protease